MERPVASVEASDIALPKRRSNRSITIAHRFEYGVVRVLFAFFRVIGLDASSAIAGKFCRFSGPLIGPISRRGINNLRRVYPDWSDQQINQTLRGIWENLGRTTAEFAHLDKFDPFSADSRITLKGADKLQAIADGDGSVIFVSGHFANWELMPVTIHRSGIDYGFVYRAANNPLVDELIIQKRAKAMSRRQIPKEKHGARALVDTLKTGRSLAMLIDQKLNDGIEAPLMGSGAMTTQAPARLALKFNAPLFPLSIVREKGAYFTISVHDAIEFTPSGDLAADTLALTTLINESLERTISAHPEQWLWLHRRWPK